MTEEDLAVIRRFAEALPEEPFGAPILRIIGEIKRLQDVEYRARVVASWDGHEGQRAARAILLGEAS